MIFRFVSRYLPPWATSIVCGGLYAMLVVAVWLRWSNPGAPFRYIGL